MASHAGGAIVYLGLAIFAAVYEVWPAVIVLSLLSLLDTRAAMRGWPMKDGPSPWVRKMIERDRRNGITNTGPAAALSGRRVRR